MNVSPWAMHVLQSVDVFFIKVIVLGHFIELKPVSQGPFLHILMKRENSLGVLGRLSLACVCGSHPGPCVRASTPLRFGVGWALGVQGGQPHEVGLSSPAFSALHTSTNHPPLELCQKPHRVSKQETVCFGLLFNMFSDWEITDGYKDVHQID